MENNIESHRIPDFTRSKEIRCRDCGHIYSAAFAAISSACDHCGNIAFHPEFSTESLERAERRENLLKNHSLKSSVGRENIFVREYHELAQDPAVLPAKVEELSIQNQNEWQLWAKITENFADSNAHLAYLCFTARNLTFDRAAERYKAHRLQYILVPREKWQVEQADAMLDRVAALCTVQFERTVSSPDMFLDSDESWAVSRKKLSLHSYWRWLFLLAGFFIAMNIWLAILLRL